MTLVQLHVVLAAVSAAVAAAIALLALVGLGTRRPLRRLIDRAILVALACVAVAVVVGAMLFITGPGPGDPLHLLYAAAALVTLPIARFGAPWLTPGSRSAALVIGGIVFVALTVRLLQTG